MASNSTSKSRSNRFSFQVEVASNEIERLSKIKNRIQSAKVRLGLNLKSIQHSNAKLMEALLDAFEAKSQLSSLDYSTAAQSQQNEPTSTSTFSSSASEEVLPRKYEIHSAASEVEDYVVCSAGAVNSLLSFLFETRSRCKYCEFSLDVTSFRLVRKDGHCGVFEFFCDAGHKIRWYTSSITSGKYTVNLRAVHAFSCTGLTETQYKSFCLAASIGCVEEKSIHSVHDTLGYRRAVNMCYQNSIGAAMANIQQDASYIAYGGDIIITDARHDSGRNAQHTTVTAVSHTNKKVIATMNWSKADHSIPCTREVPMTQRLIDDLLGDGFRVREVAHDYVPALKKWLHEKNIFNSYDTWHGGKGVKREMKKISAGTKATEGKIWFPELSDKVKATKTHVYYAMKNCQENPENLRSYILNIVDHYQGIHNMCSLDSRCRAGEGYVMSKRPLTNPKAIETFRNSLRKTTIFRNAEDFCRCRDTFWIESFHHALLTYLPKRIHFGDEIYDMRMDLAAMDWNENILRDTSSLQYYQTTRNPDRMAPTRVLTEKTYVFRDSIWVDFYKALP